MPLLKNKKNRRKRNTYPQKQLPTEDTKENEYRNSISPGLASKPLKQVIKMDTMLQARHGMKDANTWRSKY